MTINAIIFTDTDDDNLGLDAFRNYLQSDEDPLGSELDARVLALFMVAAKPITVAADLTIGVGAGVISIFTLGLVDSINRFANHQIMQSSDVFGDWALNLIQVVNPRAKVDYEKDSPTPLSQEVLSIGEGLCEKQLQSDNFFIKHVTSRLSLVLFRVAMIITRLVQTLIGALAFIASCLTLGSIEPINRCAVMNLRQLPMIIGDIYATLLGVINPSAQHGS